MLAYVNVLVVRHLPASPAKKEKLEIQPGVVKMRAAAATTPPVALALLPSKLHDASVAGGMGETVALGLMLGTVPGLTVTLSVCADDAVPDALAVGE